MLSRWFNGVLDGGFHGMLDRKLNGMFHGWFDGMLNGRLHGMFDGGSLELVDCRFGRGLMEGWKEPSLLHAVC